MRGRSRWLGVLFAAAAAGVLGSACGGGSGAGSSGSSAQATATTTDTIAISNFMFSPMTVIVAPGATVKVVNRDAVAHTLTATNGQFNTGNIDANQTKTFVAPEKPGSYHYICNIHQYMMGTIEVR